MMNIETTEEISISSSNDQTIVIKRKRTKRPRSSSSATSTTDISTSSSTEEDEDMAHCLILLARGTSPPPDKNSGERRFAADVGKVGIYVYECKTCNRTFPSFQALGGHRASHKKPKTAVEIDRKKSSPPPPPATDDQGELRKELINDHKIIAPAKMKTHECTICGSEFGSGQALGGHMRRHRAAAPPVRVSMDNVDTTSSCDIVGEDDENNVKPRRDHVLAMDFDLNLPAPPEDEKFEPPRMVFSAAALVDCHY